MRSLRSVALAMLVLLLAGGSLNSARAAQLEPSPQDPELFDLPLAQSKLDALHLEADRLRMALTSALDQVDGLTIERDFIELNDQARNEIMQDARTRARNMAINAYIGIGPPLQGAAVLDAESANDLSYRNGLLRHQAERMQDAAVTYSVLAGEANATVLELADSINDEIRVAEAHSRALTRVTEKIRDAEWVVSIAEIHYKADLAFADSRRGDPTPEQWRLLRFCESTETYGIDTGNSFYGAYQFTWDTWTTVGGEGNPAHAPAAEQDARARWLYATRGSQPWPICGRFLP